MTPFPNFDGKNMRNPGGRPKGKSLGKLIVELSSEIRKDGVSKAEHIARRVLDIAEDPETEPEMVLRIVQFMTEKVDGKPVQANINVEAEINPFADIDTGTLEGLHAKLLEMKKKEEPGK